MSDPLDLAYLAGLIDGVGSISISRKYNKSNNVVFWLSVQISMKSRDLIESVAAEENRSVYEYDTPNGTTMFKVMWQGESAYELLKRVAPYLRLKAPQAAVAIEFHEKKGRVPGKRVSALSEDERNSYRERMRALNAAA